MMLIKHSTVSRDSRTRVGDIRYRVSYSTRMRGSAKDTLDTVMRDIHSRVHLNCVRPLDASLNIALNGVMSWHRSNYE